MARFTAIAAVVLSFSQLIATFALPQISRRQDNSTSTCTTKSQRKSWHNMLDEEKSAYIEAELCLMSSPSKSDSGLAQNRWDDLTLAHIIQTNWVHDVGAFLPWHRYYVYAHEYILRTECNYTGAQPYWEESLDSGNISASVVFDPTTGFGGEGGDCVTDGPFANITLHLTGSYGVVTVSDFCLSRSFSDTAFELGNTTYLDECIGASNYSVALDCYMSSPHVAGHAGIGGTMVDASYSPAEPLFFLHHTNLDRLWWEWQQIDPETRLADIGHESNIPSYSFLSSSSVLYPGAELIDYSGDDGNITTLNHVLWMDGIVPNVTIADVMDLGGDTICAEYV